MKRAITMFAALCAAILSCQSARAADPLVVGWVERARLDPGGLTVQAKLDTGAKSSSIGAENVVESVRDGDRWVAFTVTNREGKTVRFERPVTRVANIRRAGTGVQERAVVKLGVCIGAVYAETDFTLAERRHMTYQVLVGRRFLAKRLLVDSERKYTVEPACPKPRAD